MNDDAVLMQAIARRMDEECPWSKGATILTHADWVDVVEHLWRDHGLREALITAYQPESDAATNDRDSRNQQGGTHV